MSEQNDNPVRDFEPTGDVGERGHSSFADNRDGEPAGNDERLGSRGRNSGRDESSFLDSIDDDRASRGESGGAEGASGS